MQVANTGLIFTSDLDSRLVAYVYGNDVTPQPQLCIQRLYSLNMVTIVYQ